MTFLKREVILRILGFLKANGGRVNRSAVTKGLLHKRYNRVIDQSLKHEMGKFIAVEKRKGIKREDWVLLPEGYRFLGVRTDEIPKAAPAARIQPPQTAARPISPASVLKPPQIFREAFKPPDFEPGMVPPVRSASTCAPMLKPEPARVLPQNRDDVFECLDGQLLYSDGSKADLTPEQLKEKRRAGKAIRCYPPPSPGMRYDPIAACW